MNHTKKKIYPFSLKKISIHFKMTWWACCVWHLWWMHSTGSDCRIFLSLVNCVILLLEPLLWQVMICHGVPAKLSTSFSPPAIHRNRRREDRYRGDNELISHGKLCGDEISLLEDVVDWPDFIQTLHATATCSNHPLISALCHKAATCSAIYKTQSTALLPLNQITVD